MSRREKINEEILNQKQHPYRGNVDNTYLNDKVFKEFVKHRDLKRVYVTKLGLKYRWSEEELDLMYEKAPDSYVSIEGKEFLYDYGLGENKVARELRDEKWHQPHHDHIIPQSWCRQEGWPEEKINHPDNIQILSKMVNECKRDYTLEEFKILAPLVLNSFKK